MSSRKEAPSNLEMLISEEVLPAGTTLDEAVEELTEEQRVLIGLLSRQRR